MKKNTLEDNNNFVTLHLIVWITLAVALIAIVVCGYSWYRKAVVDSYIQSSAQNDSIVARHQHLHSIQQMQTDVVTQISQLKGKVLRAEKSIANQVRTIRKEMVSQQSTIAEEIAHLEKSYHAQKAQFQQELKALSDSLVNIRYGVGKNFDSWRLQEVEQLILIANQQLQLMGDVASAIKALKFADKKLIDWVGDNANAVTEVRQHLSNEITQLEQVKQLDVTGTAAAISALSASLDRLPLLGDIRTLVNQAQFKGKTTQKRESNEKAKAPEATLVTKSESLISASRRSFFSELGDLIQVEKNSKTINPIISAEIKFLTIEKAKLILETAQIAFLKQQYPLFQQRISDVGNWVEERFDLQARETEKWLDQLSSLSQIPAQPKLPDISQSLESIRTIINQGRISSLL